MNKSRRKEIEKAMELLEEAQGIIESCRDEEQDSYDNLPESIQDGERGQSMDEAISALDDCVENIEGAIESASEAIE